MGEMLLNGRLYGASGIRELTQAQYDALPASKLTDGVLYCIKDTGIVEGEKFAPVIYSLEERKIGVWTDGKPLYQRTVHISALPSTAYTETNYPHNIANIDKICDYHALATWSSGNTTHLNHLALDGTSINNFIYSISITVDKTNVTIVSGLDRSTMTADVTIQYTKTTDIPGSGTWGTDGVPMVHYDGNEKIIGTWFGETWYEKTVILDNVSKNTWVDVSLASLGINSVHEIIVVKGRYHTPSSTWSVDANFYNSSSSFGTLGASWNVNTPRISYYYADSSANNTQLYVTIQYTKTS